MIHTCIFLVSGLRIPLYLSYLTVSDAWQFSSNCGFAFFCMPYNFWKDMQEVLCKSTVVNRPSVSSGKA